MTTKIIELELTENDLADWVYFLQTAEDALVDKSFPIPRATTLEELEGAAWNLRNSLLHAWDKGATCGA